MFLHFGMFRHLFHLFFLLLQLENAFADFLQPAFHQFVPVRRQDQKLVKFLFQRLEFIFHKHRAGILFSACGAAGQGVMQSGCHFRLTSLNQGTDGVQNRGMESAFLQSGRGPAGFWPEFQPAEAPPDNLFPSVNAPSHPAVVRAAVPANQPFRQGVFAGKPAVIGLGFFGAGRFFTPSPGQFLLDFQEYLPGKNRWVVILNIVLRQLAVVFLDLPFQEIGSVGFLQQDVACVFLILENPEDGLGLPLLPSRRCGNPGVL